MALLGLVIQQSIVNSDQRISDGQLTMGNTLTIDLAGVLEILQNHVSLMVNDVSRSNPDGLNINNRGSNPLV